MKLSNEPKHSLAFLDGLRGFAALYVMIGHARWFLWEGGEGYAAHVQDYSLPEKLQVYFFGLFKYGHQMVLFFFVLSGFVIHLRQAKSLKLNGQIKLDGYFLKRARRILPPMIFALALTFACDKLVEYMQASIYLHSTPDKGLNTSLSFDHSLTTLIGNLLFVQQTYVPVFGSNGPLWSLKFEWWFYMLYPAFILFNKTKPVRSLLLVLIISGITIAGWTWGIALVDDVFAYFFCWWLGCFAADVYTGRVRVPVWIFFAATCFLLVIPFQDRISFPQVVIRDTLVAIGFFGLLSILLVWQRRGVRLTLLERMKPLGDCSYTLYVIHGPLLVLANGILLKFTGNILPQSFVFVWLSVLVMPVIAYLVHFLVEKPFISSFAGQQKVVGAGN